MIYCTNSVIYGISCWSGVLFTIMCVRTQKFLSYASSAIFRTWYSLSVRRNCLTYVQPSRYLWSELGLPWAVARSVASLWNISLNHAVDDNDMLHEQTIRTENVQYLSESSILNPVDNSRHYKNNLLTDETVLRLSATFKLSFAHFFAERSEPFHVYIYVDWHVD